MSEIRLDNQMLIDWWVTYKLKYHCIRQKMSYHGVPASTSALQDFNFLYFTGRGYYCHWNTFKPSSTSTLRDNSEYTYLKPPHLSFHDPPELKWKRRFCTRITRSDPLDGMLPWFFDNPLKVPSTEEVTEGLKVKPS